MSTQATQDDSLIILSDDTSINFTPIDTIAQRVEVSTPDTSNMIHLDLPSISPAVSITPKETSPAPTSDFSFDFNLEAAPKVEVKKEEILAATSDISLDLTSPAPILTEEKISSQVSGNLSPIISADDDMDSILDGTIAKLKSRQEAINVTKEKKNTRIEDLSHQIEELQNQASDLRDDVSELSDEHAKIEANVKALESMKMFETPQTEEKSREHNLSKVAKK